MSLSVGAVSFTANRNNGKYNPNKKTQKNKIDNQYNQSYNYTKTPLKYAKNAVIGLLIVPPVLNSCTAEAEALAIALDNCCGCKPTVYDNRRDTVYVHDTVPTIINHHDTLYLEKDFESPVIDSINAILDEGKISHEGGYVPLKISFVDEMDTKFRKYIFNDDLKSKNVIYYDGTRSPWSDETAEFLIGTPLDQKEMYACSLTKDGKLFLRRMVPKTGVTNPEGLEDYMMAPQSFILERDQANKLIRRIGVSSDSNDRRDIGTIEPGEFPNSLTVTNDYGAKWRYTNVDVVAADPIRSEDY